MVPGAIGTQTNGSTIRPAAYLRRGRVQADARPHSAHRRADAVARARPCRPVRPHGRGRRAAGGDARRLRRGGCRHAAAGAAAVAAVAASEPPLPPRFAFVKSPAWEHAEPVTTRGLRRTCRSARRGRRRGRSRRTASAARSTCIRRSWKWRWRTIFTAITSRAATSSAPPLRELIERGRNYRRSSTPARSPASRRSTRRSTSVRRIRRHPYAGGAGRGAARRSSDRKSGFLHDLDLSRHARDHAAAVAVGSGAAARRSVGRPARQRRAPLAHGALACQNCRSADSRGGRHPGRGSKPHAAAGKGNRHDQL